MIPSAVPEQAAIDREKVRRRGLYEFLKISWPKVESAQFCDNWHIGAMAEHLQALYAGEIERLLINVPPGSGKSLITSVFFPVWVWTLEADVEAHAPGPATKFHYLSYSDALSKRDAERSYGLMQSPWWQARWGKNTPAGVHFPRAKQPIGNYRNVQGGNRITVPLGGGSTGLVHAHIQAVDDPIKPIDTQGGADTTRKVLKTVEDLWSGTLATRIADPKFFRRMITMQRLHDADLSGSAIESGNYCHLMIPLRYEPKRAYSTGIGEHWPKDPRGETGVELMWPDRTDEQAAKRQEEELGPFASAQLQQDPVPTTGGVFQRDWLKLFWSPAGAGYIPGTIALPDIKQLYTLQSWDMTFKGNADNDRVAGGAWGARGAQYFLLDQVCKRMGYADSKAEVRRFSARWPRIIRKLVEDKANGPAIVDDLKQDIPGFELVNPEGGKEARAWMVQPLFKSGCVVLPHPSMPGYEWVKGYIEELARFPKAPNDDQVDQTSQALLHMKLHAPRWAQAMSAVIEREKRASVAAAAPVAVVPERPVPAVDVEALRARLTVARDVKA